MKFETAKALVEAGSDLSLDIRIIEGYSGRGMYGKETTAIACDSRSDFLKAIAVASANLVERDDEWQDFLDDLDFSSDNLGDSLLFY